MKRLMFFALFIIVCCCCASVSGPDFPMMSENREILFVSQWDTGDDEPVVCIITESGKNTDSLPVRTLSCYRKSSSESIRLFTFDTLDYPVSLFQTQDSGGQLFTTWTGGSAYHFYVFACIDGNIRKVLETGSKTTPEFLTDSDGNDIVVISDTFTDISTFYKWNGERYEVIRKVSREKRFQ